MIGYTKKPEWMSERVWRSWRTFVQAFIPVLLANISAISVSGEVDWYNLALQILVPAMSAGLAAIANGSTEDAS